MSVPVFAVVGHPNKGKSSMVATLAEQEDIAISPLPGTTRRAREFTFFVEGEPQYTLVDTPGFQRAREVALWLQAQGGDASARPGHVRRFVDTHRADPRFADEVELLQPIIDGASILYVVDAAKPYGAEYELDMQILQWSGRPRLALINRIGTGDFRDQWRKALGQYFSIVRDFDAVHADFDTRLGVLRALAELQHDAADNLTRTIEAMQTARVSRRQRCASLIANHLASSLVLQDWERLEEGDDQQAVRNRLQARLMLQLRDSEDVARAEAEAVYGYHRLTRESSSLPVLDTDLFAAESWELFGLSRRNLLVTATLGGAAAGGVIDLAVGGASFFLGSMFGGLLGGASAWLGGDELARMRIMGEPLGGMSMRVGPVTAPNFPWVLLGRSLVHHQLVSERNHAQRSALALEAQASPSMLDHMDAGERRRLAGLFSQLEKGDSRAVEELTSVIDRLLSLGNR